MTNHERIQAIRAKLHEALKLVDQLHAESSNMKSHILSADLDDSIRKNFSILTELSAAEQAKASSVEITTAPQAEPVQPTKDFAVEDDGNLALVVLHSDKARCWVSEHVQGEVQYWCGKMVVEARFLAGLVDGMLRDGLTQG